MVKLLSLANAQGVLLELAEFLESNKTLATFDILVGAMYD